MSQMKQQNLVVDRKGMVWDLMLYIPTVVALASIATSFWFGDNQNMGYLFYFLASFFVMAGVNRIFKTRLMLFPSAPISILVSDDSIVLGLKKGDRVNLIKNVKYYPDYSGKTFGISGLDGSGKLQQFVFHKGQFELAEDYDAIQKMMKEKFR